MTRWQLTSRHFQVRHCNALWRSNIPDYYALKWLVDHSTFVTMDVYMGESEVRGVGLTCLQIPAEDLTAFDEPCQEKLDLGDLAQKYGFRSRYIRVTGTKEVGLRQRKRESFAFGEVEILAAGDLQETLRLDLKAVGDEARRNLVLVGFEISSVLRMISDHYSELAQLFTAWVDLQEIVHELAGVSKGAGIRNVLTALGFPDESLAVPRELLKLTPGNTSARIAAVLLCIATPSKRPALCLAPPNRSRVRASRRVQDPEWIANRSSNKSNSSTPRFTKMPDADTTLWHSSKPGPPEQYPFIAKVKPDCSMASKKGHAIFETTMLFDAFSGFITPKAVSALGIRCEKGVGWVCFPSLGALDHFVERANGAKDSHGRIWTVVEDESCNRSAPEPLSIWQILKRAVEGQMGQQYSEASLEKKAAKARNRSFDWTDMANALDMSLIAEEQEDEMDVDTMEADDDGEAMIDGVKAGALNVDGIKVDKMEVDEVQIEETRNDEKAGDEMKGNPMEVPKKKKDDDVKLGR
ncbi:hypothetical protein B0T14DRAFT_489858 [Immersiella caudata]|uniref:Uncharacterized protein n=1 Tax=Immersiella caudata TaxID=314043 RepID=A0AA40CBB5_9PEZI|nr:hypothetical protein B0T14DRAFT_489858 [Immersiella caudata]